MNIKQVVEEADSIWGGDRAAMLAQTDEWFRQNGMMTPFVINNLVAYVLACDRSTRDAVIQINNYKGTLHCYVALTRWGFFWKKKKLAMHLQTMLCSNFPTFDVYIVVMKYKRNWEQQLEPIEKTTTDAVDREPEQRQVEEPVR